MDQLSQFLMDLVVAIATAAAAIASCVSAFHSRKTAESVWSPLLVVQGFYVRKTEEVQYPMIRVKNYGSGPVTDICLLLEGTVFRSDTADFQQRLVVAVARHTLGPQEEVYFKLTRKGFPFESDDGGIRVIPAFATWDEKEPILFAEDTVRIYVIGYSPTGRRTEGFYACNHGVVSRRSLSWEERRHVRKKMKRLLNVRFKDFGSAASGPRS